MTGRTWLPARPAQLLIADRLAALHVLRLALAGLVVLAVAAAPGATGDVAGTVVPLTAGYLLMVAVAEMARRLEPGGRYPVTTALLFIDGLWLAVVREQTGGSTGVLAGLVIVHLVAVMILGSHRTGLRVALWHAALFLIMYAAELSSGQDPRQATLEMTATEASVFTVIGFLVIAAGTALFSAVNEHELRRGRRDMGVLADLAVALDRGTDEADLVREALSRAIDPVDGLGFRRAVMLTTRDGVARLHRLDGATGQVVDRNVAGADLVYRQALTQGELRLVEGLSSVDDPELSTALPDAVNVAVVPLVAERRPFGALIVEHGGRLGACVVSHRVDLARQFATHVALSLRGAWLHAEVERLANQDQLTGLANRRVFESVLGRELERARRAGTACALLMIDADHFKRVNDVHGHQAGDDVLRALGRVLQAETREVDLAARYGGEELVVVVPGATGPEAMVLAERIRRAVEGDETLPVPVTVSVGVASFPSDGADAGTVVASADAALYRSKDRGRNRVTLAGSPRPRRSARDRGMLVG